MWALHSCRANGNVSATPLPQLCSAWLGKRGSFLNYELGMVSDLREVQLSHRAGLACFRKCNSAVCAVLCHLPWLVSQQARGIPTPRHPQMLFISHQEEQWPALFCTQARICRGGSGEWHIPHWQGMAASVPTTVIYSLWVWARRDLKSPGLLKKIPPVWETTSSIIVVFSIIVVIII